MNCEDDLETESNDGLDALPREELIRELRDSERVRNSMRELLIRTANALKGDPGPLKMHSWADLPIVAARLKENRE